MSNQKYVARIIETDTGKVEWQSQPVSERDADRMAAGASINLNWDRFHTEVVESKKRERA